MKAGSRERRGKWPLYLLASVVGVGACHGASHTMTGANSQSSLSGEAPQTFQLTVAAADVDTRFVTRDHFMAAVEMQLSGEPLASLMVWVPFAPQGRNLALYSR